MRPSCAREQDATSLQQHLQPVHSRSNQLDIRADSIWQQLTAKWAAFFAFGLAASIEDDSWRKQKFSNDQDELQPALSQASHHKGFLKCLKDKDVNRRETAKSSVIICDFTISRKNRRNLPNLARVVQNVKFWGSHATEEILRRSSDACSSGRLSVPAMSQLSAPQQNQSASYSYK